MSERVILELSPGWCVLADPHQWILAKQQNLTAEDRNKRRTARFKGVAYVAHRKSVLLRCAREKSVTITPEAMQVILSWPVTFRQWHAQQGERRAA